MPSTYTTNNGIEKIGNGEQSGAWGTTTNTNFDLIDTSLDGFVTVTLPATGSSGSPNTISINDGASSNGRNRYVRFDDAVDLGGDVFVQLTPNDAEKIMVVENALSGGQNILLFQGTYDAGRDYTIPNGEKAMVSFDGGGTTATVTLLNIISNIGPNDDVDINGGSMDGVVIGANEASAATFTTITGSDDLNIDDGTFFVDAGTSRVGVGTDSPQSEFHVVGVGETIRTEGPDGSSNFISFYRDAAREAYVGFGGAGDNFSIYNETATGNVNILSDFGEVARFDSGGDTNLFGDLLVAGEASVTGVVSADKLYLSTNIANDESDIKLEANANIAGASSINYLVEASGYHAWWTGIDSNDTGQQGGNEVMRLTDNGSLGIGTSAPDRPLTVFQDGFSAARIQSANGSSAVLELTESGSGSQSVGVRFGDGGNTSIGLILYDNNSDSMRIDTNGAQRVTILANGNVGIGDTNPGRQLQVTGNIGATNNIIAGGTGFFDKVDVSTNSVGAESDIALSSNSIITSEASLQFGVTGSSYIWYIGTNSRTTGNAGGTAVAAIDGSSFWLGEGGAVFNAGNTEFRRTGYTKWYRDSGTSTTGFHDFFSDVGAGTGNNVARMQANGDWLNEGNSYGALSDESLKEDISDASGQWNDIKRVRLRNYTLKSNGERHIGVIAQELQDVSPYLVQETEEGLLAVKYSVLYTKAIGALQEAMQRIEQLEERVADLEARTAQ